jgi:hypothetical protein
MDSLNNYILSLTQYQISNLYVITIIILIPFLILMFANYNRNQKRFMFSISILYLALGGYFYAHHQVNNYYLSLNKYEYAF